MRRMMLILSIGCTTLLVGCSSALSLDEACDEIEEGVDQTVIEVARFLNDENAGSSEAETTAAAVEERAATFEEQPMPDEIEEARNDLRSGMTNLATALRSSAEKNEITGLAAELQVLWVDLAPVCNAD